MNTFSVHKEAGIVRRRSSIRPTFNRMNTFFTDVLTWTIIGNSVRLWLLTVGVFIVLLLGILLLQSLGLRMLKEFTQKSRFIADDIIVDFLHGVPRTIWVLMALLFALRLPVLPEAVERILMGALLVLCVIIAIILIQRVIAAMLLLHIPQFRQEKRQSLPAVMQISITLILWVLGVLLILSNLGVNVISLIAGLGIGGIAIALAVQNILGDIFSSYSLYFDQPFKEGDFIIVGNEMGTVKKIGLKTTRIQALQGEEIIIPNQELTTARVQNHKRMFERRIIFSFGISYDTPLEKVRPIPGKLKDIISAKEHVRFDRAHFARLGEKSLEFEIVYFMKTPDYNLSMDTQQAINLEIMDYITSQGIAFAVAPIVQMPKPA